MAKIRLNHTSSGGSLILPLKEPVTLFGRGDECDYGLRDTKVSRRHFSIRKNENDKWVLFNESKFGTLLNGSRVDECVLGDGDEISVPSYTCIFQDQYRADDPDLADDPTPVKIHRF